jgi:hypothetical protein
MIDYQPTTVDAAPIQQKSDFRSIGRLTGSASQQSVNPESGGFQHPDGVTARWTAGELHL